jgi:DNA-binding transcriptional MerR regulator
MSMTVGELAREAGVNLETVRFYEKQRLLPAPERTRGGHRKYGRRDVDRLHFIQRAKSVGFSLKEIRVLSRLREADPGESCEEAMELAHRKLGEIDAKLGELHTMRDTLAEFIRGCPGKDIAHCQVMQGLEGDHV